MFRKLGYLRSRVLRNDNQEFILSIITRPVHQLFKMALCQPRARRGGCPLCKKKINTTAQLLDHLAVSIRFRFSLFEADRIVAKPPALCCNLKPRIN